MSKRRSLIAGLVAAVAATSIGVAAIATGVGSQVPGKNGVKSSDIAPGHVRNSDLAKLRWTPLRPRNGWGVYGLGTRPPKISFDGRGIVYMRGAIKRNTGTSDEPFVLPRKFRPSVAVFVVAAVHNNTAAQLQITPDGRVVIQTTGPAQPGTLTSLEGVSFSR
jgi:hypothetical protein